MGGNNSNQPRPRIANRNFLPNRALLPIRNGAVALTEDYAYKPVVTLLDIVALGKEMQGREEIYKGFIKETLPTEQPNQPAKTGQPLQQQPTQ